MEPPFLRLFPGEKGWFPEAAVGQTGGEEKNGRLGWRGVLNMRRVSRSDSWTLPRFWPRGAQTARLLSVLSDGVSSRLPKGRVVLLHMC